jgi:transcriptional regulator with XRE-family HTH domain
MTAPGFDEFEAALRSYVRELRLDSGATQVEFANRGNLRQSTIAKFEAGYSPNVTLKTVYEVAQAGDVPLSEMIRKAEGVRIRSSNKEESWESIERDVRRLPAEKKKWLARVIREIIRGVK